MLLMLPTSPRATPPIPARQSHNTYPPLLPLPYHFFNMGISPTYEGLQIDLRNEIGTFTACNTALQPLIQLIDRMYANDTADEVVQLLEVSIQFPSCIPHD